VLVFYTDKGDASQGEQRLARYLQDNWLALDLALQKTRAEQAASASSPALGSAVTSNN